MMRPFELLRTSGSRRATIAASAVAVGLLNSYQVSAQEASGSTNVDGASVAGAPASQPQGAQIGDIIVTAERRSQRLQEVPISITAVSAATLATAGIVNTSQLSQVTPGLVTPENISGNASFTPFIRGVGSGTAVPGIDASVALYVDGVYQASKYLNQIDLANIDRVEILKGPQGTLYGRNATGGAINIITKKPSDTLEGSASFSYGRFDEAEEKFYLSGPLAQGLNASLGVVAHQGGDYGRNRTTGNKFGGLNSVTVNGQLGFTPTDRLDINLSGIYSRRRGRQFSSTGVFDPANPPFGGLIGGQFSTNPRELYTDIDPKLNSHSYSGAAHVRYSLDSVDLLSITSYKKGNYHSQLDSDGSSLPILTILFSAPSKTFTQEVQAVSTAASPFQWIVGGYYISSSEEYSPFGVIVAPTPVQYFTNNKTKGGSIFAQGTYEVAAGTKITGGLRYSIEKRSILGTLVAPTLGNIIIGGPLDEHKTFKKLTWRLSIDHKLSDDVLVYASYNRGFKSGAFNPLSVAPTSRAANPEVLDAYEVGIKSQVLDRTVQVNAAGYYYKYKNIQVQHVVLGSGSSVAVLENAAAATLYGIDGDVVIAPTRDLRLTGGFNLEHSKYDNYSGASGFTLVPGGAQSGVFDLTGDQVLNAPKLTFTAAASYTVPVGEAGAVLFDVNYSHSSFFKISPGEGNFVRPYGILNASIGFTDADKRYKLELWGRNLTNVKTFGQYTIALASSLTTRVPTTYGATISTRF